MAAAPLPSEDLELDLFLLHPDPPSPSVFLDLPPPPTPTPTPTKLLPLPLPTNNATLLLHDARGRKNRHAAARDNDNDDGSGDPESRRATKLMLPAQTADEAEARRMFDEMMIHERDDVCINMKGVQQQDLASTDATDTTQKAKTRRRPRRRSSTTAGTGSGSNDGPVDLHTLLLRCAQAVATDNRGAAQDLLAHIRRHSSPTGDATQRLAHYFAEGLEARLAGTGSRLYHSLMLRRTSVADFLRAYRLYMAACCCKKVAFIFSNRTIHYAVAVAAGSGKRRLHIVDYGLGYGFQWPGLLRGLAVMNGGPPELVRITGIDLPQPGFRPAQQIEDTGRRLSDCARQLGVPFKFRGIAAKRESVSPEDLDIDPVAEVVVVISLCHFRLLTDEIDISATAAAVPRRSRPSPRDQVLGNIRQMRPDVFIHGVVSGGYGTTYFSTRFREALFHYSAQFDLLDATVPRDSPERLLVERDIFGHAAMNIVTCEGTDRVERPETYRHWQAKNRRAGLRQLPLQAGVVKVVMDKVKDNYHRDFVVDEDQGWLLHRWKGRVLYGLSTWVAS